MTAGTPKVVVRIPPSTQNLIQCEVDARNFGRDAKPYTVSDFIRSAVSEKLKHLARGRKNRRERKDREDEMVREADAILDELIKGEAPEN